MRVSLGALGLTVLAIDPFWSQAFSAVLVLVGVIVTAVLTTRASRRADTTAKAAKSVATSTSKRLDAIEAALAEHEDWDREAFAVIRLIDPTFPPPPPLTITDQE